MTSSRHDKEPEKFFSLFITNLQIFACQTAKENENLYICECSFCLHLTMSRHGKKSKAKQCKQHKFLTADLMTILFLLYALLTYFATPFFSPIVVSWLRKKSKTATNMGQFDINTFFYIFF